MNELPTGARPRKPDHREEPLMDAHPRVLILGATGRTGGRVLTQLLERGVPVRAIVRSADRLPAGSAGNPLLDVVEADLLGAAARGARRAPRGLRHGHLVPGSHHQRARRPRAPASPGHTSVRRVCGRRRRLRATGRRPVRLILMSSVSVHRPGAADARGAAASAPTCGHWVGSCRRRATTSAPRTSWPTRSGRTTPTCSGWSCGRTP